MFSGIVETIGVVTTIRQDGDNIHFSIDHSDLFDDIHLGDSISINGVCLTVTDLPSSQVFSVTAVPETLRLTNLSAIKTNDAVNLERSIKASTRIGGHFVQGHVDACSEIIDIKSDGDDAMIVTFSLPAKLNPYVVDKGYICIDGMSITVIEVGNDCFNVTFIPHTRDNTVVQNYNLGDKVNIEVDMMAKYIKKYMQEYSDVLTN